MEKKADAAKGFPASKLAACGRRDDCSPSSVWDDRLPHDHYPGVESSPSSSREETDRTETETSTGSEDWDFFEKHLEQPASPHQDGGNGVTPVDSSVPMQDEDAKKGSFEIIKEWHAVIADKQCGNRTTIATTILKQVKQDFKETHKGAKKSKWFADAQNEYERRIAEHFSNMSVNEDLGLILVKCTKEVVESGRVAETNRYGYAGDDKPTYGRAELPKALHFFFESRDPATLESEVQRFRNNLNLLRQSPLQPPEDMMHEFDQFLSYCEARIKASKHTEMAKWLLQDLKPIPLLKKLWKHLENHKRSVSPDTPVEWTGNQLNHAEAVCDEQSRNACSAKQARQVDSSVDLKQTRTSDSLDIGLEGIWLDAMAPPATGTVTEKEAFGPLHIHKLLNADIILDKDDATLDNKCRNDKEYLVNATKPPLNVKLASHSNSEAINAPHRQKVVCDASNGFRTGESNSHSQINSPGQNLDRSVCGIQENDAVDSSIFQKLESMQSMISSLTGIVNQLQFKQSNESNPSEEVAKAVEKSVPVQPSFVQKDSQSLASSQASRHKRGRRNNRTSVASSGSKKSRNDDEPQSFIPLEIELLSDSSDDFIDSYDDQKFEKLRGPNNDINLSSLVYVWDKKLQDADGSEGVFTGTILHGTETPHGSGRFDYGEHGGFYEGQWSQGNWHGRGRRSTSDGEMYEGDFEQGRRHGWAVLTLADGGEFQGRFEYGDMVYGTMNYPDGTIYRGRWDDGFHHGKGTLSFSSGAKYYGHFRNGQKDGFGKEYGCSGALVYEGQYAKDVYSGSGKYFYPDGRKYIGKFKSGVSV